MGKKELYYGGSTGYPSVTKLCHMKRNSYSIEIFTIDIFLLTLQQKIKKIEQG